MSDAQSPPSPAGLHPRLVGLLVCPACRGVLLDQAEGLICPACARLYPVREGVPRMTPEESRAWRR